MRAGNQQLKKLPRRQAEHTQQQQNEDKHLTTDFQQKDSDNRKILEPKQKREKREERISQTTSMLESFSHFFCFYSIIKFSVTKKFKFNYLSFFSLQQKKNIRRPYEIH